MKRSDFKAAVQRANTEGFNPDFSTLDVFSGCALDKKRRFVTFNQVASLIVYQAYTFSGTWDQDALQELEQLSKRFDLID
jgi:hypothetical protein